MALFLKKLFSNMKTKHKLSEDRQLTFLKRLSRLLASGYSLVAALEVIKWDRSMEQLSEAVIYYLKRGSPLDVAFQKVHFHDTITAYLYFARLNDNLVISLDKAIVMFEHRMTYIKKFTQVIRYPILLLFIFIILLYFIKKSILPSFIQLFQTDMDSSKTVLLSIQLIDYASNFAIFTLVFGVSVFIIWHLMKSKIAIDLQIKLITKVPFVNTYTKMQTSYYFATHMSMLLKTGMSIKDILKNMSRQMKLPILAYYAQLMTSHLSKGYYVSSLLTELALLEEQLGEIFQNNSNASTLEQDLTAYADLLAENIQLKMMKIMAYIQPLFFILLASLIVFIYVTLMWPMFQLIKTM